MCISLSEQLLIYACLDSLHCRTRVLEDLKAYEELRLNLETLKVQNQRELHTRIRLGPDVMVQAYVPDATKICMSTGLGFHVECTWDEALALIPKRKAVVQAQVRTGSARRNVSSGVSPSAFL